MANFVIVSGILFRLLHCFRKNKWCIYTLFCNQPVGWFIHVGLLFSHSKFAQGVVLSSTQLHYLRAAAKLVSPAVELCPPPDCTSVTAWLLPSHLPGVPFQPQEQKILFQEKKLPFSKHDVREVCAISALTSFHCIPYRLCSGVPIVPLWSESWEGDYWNVAASCGREKSWNSITRDQKLFGMITKRQQKEYTFFWRGIN